MEVITKKVIQTDCAANMKITIAEGKVIFQEIHLVAFLTTTPIEHFKHKFLK